MSVLSEISIAIRDILRWRYALLNWIGEAYLVWVTLLVVLIAPVLAFWLKSEPAFRVIGLVLQLLGFVTVAWNIRETQATFQRPGIISLSVEWWGRRPRFRSQVIVAAGAAFTLTSSGRAYADIWHNADPDADSAIEARLDAAEKNLGRIRDRLNEFERETRQSLQRQDGALHQEKLDRAKENESVREKLEAAQTGGLHISLMGVVWLVEGVIMSTISSELHSLAGYLLHP